MQRRPAVLLGSVEIDLRAAAVSAGLLAAFVILGVLVSVALLSVDVPLLNAFGGLRETPLWPLLDLLNLLGYPAPWDSTVVVASLVAAVLLQRRLPLALTFGLALAEALAVVAKLVVGRIRPDGIVIQDLVTPAAYPSGHVVRVVVTVWLAVLLAWPWLRRHRLAPLAVVGALVVSAWMGAARAASGEHWPSDVLGAYLLSGAFIAGVAAVRPVAAEAPRGSSS